MADEDLSKLKIDKSRQGFQAKKRKKPFYLVIAAIFVALVLILFMTGVFSPAVKVEVASVVQTYPSQTFTLLNASGYVVPQRKSSVAAKATGRLVALYVEEGNKIKKDQIIAQLENEDLAASRRQALANVDVSRAGYEQAKAELNDAQVSFERQKQLLSKELVAKSDYDTAEARYKKAIAALASADASIKAAQAALSGVDVSLEYTRIRAPFDAVVLTKNADVGDIVTPLGAAANAKSAVVTIADMASLQVETDVSESNIEKLKPGQPCEIQLDAVPETRFPGTHLHDRPHSGQEQSNGDGQGTLQHDRQQNTPRDERESRLSLPGSQKGRRKIENSRQPESHHRRWRKEVPFCGETEPGQTDSGNSRRTVGRHGGDTQWSSLRRQSSDQSAEKPQRQFPYQDRRTVNGNHPSYC